VKAFFLEEPELQFGGGGRHIDIRFGIMDHGPLDLDTGLAPTQINLGIVGNLESVEGSRQWLEKCRSEITAKHSRSDPNKPSKQPKLFTRFPGFALDTAFHSTLVMDDAFCRAFSNDTIEAITKLPDQDERISRSVDLFVGEIQFLAQNTEAKVILCAVPAELLEAMGPRELDAEESEDSAPGPAASHVDFHDMLKASAMQQYRKPIQVILPSTYGARHVHKVGRRKELQDEATRAWNIHTAIYYKAGGVPWRLPKESNEYTVCYVGVSFYKSLEKNALLTSVAQVFNERGEGVIVRGGAATISKDDRQPHLSEGEAHNLISDALTKYREVHKTHPARVVIHKSSRFDASEERGFEAALTAKNISSHDFLWLSRSTTKLFRAGKYPPLRGTMLALDEREMILYTKGSVDFFETYPGMYVPTPLRIRSDNAEQTQRFLAQEILALTKMNWNQTQFDGSEPVTLQASRKCSSVLRYCSEGRQIEPRYSFYM
jgi:hypothetical protein